MPAPQPRDVGFTLVEVLVVTVLIGIMLGLAANAWRPYAAAREQRGAGEQVREVLRQAQQQAVTEGTSICVSFTGTTFQPFRGACDSPSRTAVTAARPLPGGMRFDSAAFATGAGPSVSAVTFRSRGSATPGQVALGRSGSTAQTIITVEGLTGRVAFD